jgi:hypothetical protein
MSTIEEGASEGLFAVRELIETARSNAGVGDPAILDTPGLRALSHGLYSATDDLNFISIRRAHRLLLETLVKRLRVEHHLQREPAIREIRLQSPIFLVAPARTGTTFLHRLLAQDPAHRTLRLWEALQAPPVEPEYQGDPAYFEKDYRVPIARKYLRTRERYSPEIATIHPTDVNAPEECFGLLETSMLSHSFTFYGPIFEYLDWLDQRSDEEWLEAYRLYADQLRLLQWWAPGERWVLKTPFHMWAVDAICAVFPDALIVQQHRTPADCIASYCSLMEVAFAPIAVGFSRARIGRIAMDYYRQALARNVAARKSLSPDRFIDIDYRDLVNDPIACVRRIYAAAGTPLDDETEARIRAWLEAQSRSRKRKKHEYCLEDYGLSEDEVEAAFEGYSKFNTERRAARVSDRD